MEKTSRIIAIMLAAVMCLALCACGKDKTTQTPALTEAPETENPLPTPTDPGKPLYTCLTDDGTKIVVDGEGDEMTDYAKSGSIDNSEPTAVSPSPSPSPSAEPTQQPTEIVNPEITPFSSPTHKHNYVTQVIDPTCKTKGYTLHICDCGASYKDQYTDIIEHSYSNEVIKPTATEQGYTIHTCTICGYEYKDDFVDILFNEK